MQTYGIRRSAAALVVAASFFAPLPAEANLLCKWFGRCLYESPGFRITVVDKETGQPLAEVHALAEWVQHGSHGRAGPLMVQDAVSGPDGVLTFPAWGPERGYRLGLMLNLDPAITLFKPGYRTLLIQNAYPRDTTETTRVRHFGQDGQTFTLKPFRGSLHQRMEELRKAAYPDVHGRVSAQQIDPFRSQFLGRLRYVWSEAEKLPHADRDIENFVSSLERNIRSMEEGVR